MNAIINTLKTRRSVRKWQDRALLDSDIIEILEVGMNAPSAGNEQAWQFVVITDKKILQKYAEINKNVAFVRNAAAAILVCGDIEAQKYPGFYLHDCSAASENILLAIHAKGLGGVWGNVFPDAIPEIKQLLHIPDRIQPFSIIPFGYPEKVGKYQNRFNNSKVHTNKW